jgi:membrane associated rhomboid family serine protease
MIFMRITEILILICVVVFFGQLILGPQFESLIALHPASLIDAPWMVFTSMFAHGDMQHLFFNMFALFIFGGALERRLGKGNFLLLYLVSGVIGSVGFMLLNSPFQSALGASGAIYGAIGGVALLMPNMIIYLMGVPMPMYVAGFVYVIIELVGLGAADGIAHSAHLIGLFGGVGMAALLRNSQEDLGISKAFAVGALLSLLVGVGFGYYYASDPLVSDIKECEDTKLEVVSDALGVASCLGELSEEYKNEASKEMICEEFARFSYYARLGYSESYEECMKDD